MKKRRSLLSLLLALSLVLSWMPMPAAAETVCTHHVHDAQCAYVVVEGKPCTHQCNESCPTKEVTLCVHDHAALGCTRIPAVEGVTCDHAHGESCGYVPAQEGVAAQCGHVHGECAYKAPIPESWGCGHVCTKDSGCVKTVCAHVHDDACGFVQEVKGCTFVCGECQPEETACTCESTDPGEHAPFCDLYVRTYEECKCVLDCAVEGLNTYCETCYFEGAETCGASGEEENVPFESVTITITGEPSPPNLIYKEYGTVTLGINAKVSNGSPLSYQWYQCDDSGKANARPAANGTGKYLTVPKNLEPGKYYFYCVLSAEGAESVDSNVVCVCVLVPHQITLTSSEGGSVIATKFGSSTPLSSAISGTQIFLKPTANEGYQFKQWQVISGGISISSGNNSFYMRDADVTIHAVFEKIGTVESYTVTAAANPTAGGTVTGGGTYEENTSVTLTATAAEGYEFVNWTESGTQVSTSASYTFTVTGNRNLVANFQAEPPQVIPGTITITGQPNNTYLDYGYGTRTLGVEANASNGSTLTYQWYQCDDSGKTNAQPKGTQRNLIIPQGLEPGKYHFYCTVSAEGAESVDTNVVWVHVRALYQIAVTSTEGGAVSGGGTYTENTSVTVTATANEGYRFTGWTENGATVSTDPSYTFPATGNRNLTAVFAAHTHSWTYTASGATITTTCANTDGLCPNTSGGSVTISASDATYDGTAKAASLSAASVGDVEDLIIVYEGLSSAPVNAGTYTASLTVGGETASVTYTIARKALTVQAEDQTITYGGTPDSTKITGTGLISGHSLTATLTPSTTNVTSSGTVTPSAAVIRDGSNKDVTANYDITYRSGALTITKASATAENRDLVIYNNLEKVYSIDIDSLLPAQTSPMTYGKMSFSIPGIRLGDYYRGGASLIGHVLYLPIESVDSTEEGVIGTLNISFTTDNFTVSNAVITVRRINKTALNITGVTAVEGLTYNGTAQAGYTGTPAAAGYTDPIQVTYTGTGTTTYGPTSTAPTNAGTYAVKFSIPGNDPQYRGETTLNFTIAKAVVTITADDKTAVEGDAKPALTYQVTGLVGQEQLTAAPTLTCTADMSKPGEYPITPASAQASDNYTITYVPGKLTVHEKYAVKVATATNGSVTVSPDKAPAGAQVTITVTPRSGYHLASLTVKDATGKSCTVSSDSIGKYSFTMPAAEVTVTATFSKTATADPTNPRTSSEFSLVLWSGMAATSLLCMAAMTYRKKKRG